MTCAICGKDVSKRQSYYIGTDDDGNPLRACKTHPEAQEYQQKVAKEQQQRLQQLKETKTRRLQSSPIHPEQLRCWCCGQIGKHEREFYMRLLVNMQKAEILGKKIDLFNPANDPAAMATCNELEGYVPLRVVDISKLETWQLRQLVPLEDMRMAANATGFALLCIPCIEKYDLTIKVDKPKLPPEEQLKNWAVLGAAMKPVIRQQALAEITTSN